MLTQILQRVQAFERRHKRRPNTLFLTRELYSRMRQEYPQILGDTPEIVLGLRITLAPDDSLLQPEIAWLPASVPGYLRRKNFSRQPKADNSGEFFDLSELAVKDRI